ncbi:MAG: glycosyltransferase [Gemmatimonadota bacterium]|nr:MAG: glycosyltransferase [Gemmatimonadota bacterium]
MRIVTLAHSYPRWDGDVAGAFIERLVLALRQRSHRVSVIVPADKGQGGTIEHKGVPITRVRYAPAQLEVLAYSGRMREAVASFRGIASFATLVLAQTWATTQEVHSDRVDLIHAHWWLPGGITSWLAAFVGHRPYVLTLHGTDVAILEKSSTARRLARAVMRKASAITAVSSFLAERAAHVAGIESSQILVQPMPLDVELYSTTSSGGAGIVTVGRLVQQKRVALLLEAVARLHKSGTAVPLTVVGDGPERRSLEYHATQLGIHETTRFVGSVEPEQIPAAIGDADVFVFPAHDEGLGLAVAEALMLGVPVVAAKEGGGVADLVPASGAGRLIDGVTADKLAEAIQEVLRDASSRSAAAEHGAGLKRRLAPDAAAQVFEAVYASVAQRARDAGA